MRIIECVQFESYHSSMFQIVEIRLVAAVPCCSPPQSTLHACMHVLVFCVMLRSAGVVTEGRAAQEVLTSSSITEPHPAHGKDVRRTFDAREVD